MSAFIPTVIETIKPAVTLATAQQQQQQLDNNRFPRSRGSFHDRGNREDHLRDHTFNNIERSQGGNFSLSGGYNNYYPGLRL